MDEQIFKFLSDLSQNNNRDWFNDNKSYYEDSKEKAYEFFKQIAHLLDKEDEFSPFKMYRIYRDLRFSKDKTPYKTHFSAVFSRKQPYNRGSFYIHLEPGKSYVGGGFWNPNKDDLLRIRKAIEIEDDLEIILKDSQLIKAVGGLKGEALKTAPKGFEKNHPRIELLRWKQFIMGKDFTDKEIFSPDFSKNIIEIYRIIRPFFLYMTEVLTTDENGELIV